MYLFRHLWSLAPRETWRLMRRRLPILRNGPVWTPADLLSSVKHRYGIRFAELLLRQEAAMRQHTDWEPLDFSGRRVVEIGCGPLGGYGPLAVFCGARSFESAEPEWDPDLFASPEIRERYLYTMHVDLAAVYGEQMDFDTFLARLDERMTVRRTSFASTPVDDKADIVISQSCLEHVFPLQDTIAKLAKFQTPETRFLHLVDFGNHYFTESPFDGLYEQPPQEYIARRGKAINMLRVPDIVAMFAEHGIEVIAVPSRVLRANYHGTIHPWWHERYDDDALFTQLALIAGPVGTGR